MNKISETITERTCELCNTQSVLRQDWYHVIDGETINWEYNIKRLYCEYCDKVLDEEYI